MSTKRKIIIIIIVVLSVILVAGGIVGGLYYKNGIEKAEKTAEIIDCLPDEINDYEGYDYLINEAYTSYQKLAGWQKKKVSNKNKLRSIVRAYAEYKADNLRAEMQKVTVDSIKTSTVLSDVVDLYNEMDSDQRNFLTEDERYVLDNYLKVNDVINGINDIYGDVVNKYGELSDLQKIYRSIDAEYVELVYNYDLIKEFGKQLEFLKQFIFTVSGDGYSIKAADDVVITGALVIPEIYSGKQVVAIEENAFSGQRELTSVEVPNSVTSIGCGAFKGCNKLESISLPFTGNSMNSSAYNAVLGYVFGYTEVESSGQKGDKGEDFVDKTTGNVDGAVWQYSCYNGDSYRGGYLLKSYYCNIPSSLRKVTITKQTEVKTAAFNSCKNITEIKYTQGLTGIGVASFLNCENLELFNSEKKGTADLTGEYLAINIHAFKNCLSINEVKIPSGVVTVADYCFENVPITKIVIPETVELIGRGAFYGCNKLEEITLPFTGNSMNSSAYNAVFGFIFDYDTKTNTDLKQYSQSDTFVNKNAMSHDTAIWQYSCYNVLANTMVTMYKINCYYYHIPRSLKSVIVTKQTEVKTAAFNGCTTLTSITYTQGIESKGECAFQNCTATVNE